MKRKTIILSMLIATIFTIVPSFTFAQDTYNISTKISTRAWSGRPGGNGDGSEEWLVGNKGQTNGAYRLVSSNSGKVKALNDSRSYVVSGVLATIGLGGNAYTAMLSGFIGFISSSSTFEGVTYKLDFYVSGRRGKIIIITYTDNHMKDKYKEYTEYVEW